jgi:hypothetical protein
VERNAGHSIFQKQPQTMDKNKLGNYVTFDFTKNIGADLYLGFDPQLGTALQLEEGL